MISYKLKKFEEYYETQIREMPSNLYRSFRILIYVYIYFIFFIYIDY